MARISRESNFKMSYIPVILSSLLLLFLVCGLIYVIFFLKDKSNEKFHGKALGNYTVEAKVVNYQENEVFDTMINVSDLDKYDSKILSITNKVNSGFTDKNILIGSPNIIEADKDIILYSIDNPKNNYIGRITLDGKTKWINELSNKNDTSIINVFYKNNNTYVIYKSDNKIIGQIIDKKGKFGKKNTIINDIKDNLFDITINNDRFIYYLYDKQILKLFEMNLNYKNNKEIEFENKDDYKIASSIIKTMSSDGDNTFITYDIGGKKHVLKIDKDNKIKHTFFKVYIYETDKVKAFNQYLYIYNDYYYVIYNLTNKEYTVNKYSYELDVEENSEETVNEVDKEDPFYDDSTDLFNVNEVYTNNKNNNVVLLKEYSKIGYDIYLNNKLRKRIFIDSEDDKFELTPSKIIFNNNYMYIIYVLENSNIYINKVKCGD